MISRLITPLIWRQEVTFDMPGSAEDGLRLLRDAVHSPYALSFVQGIVGNISDTQVTVWRYRPFARIGFPRVFYGRFFDGTEGARLGGYFAMDRSAKVFTSLWLSMVVCFTVLAVLRLPTLAGSEALLLLLPLGMLTFGLGIMHLSWWFSREDTDYITGEITKALQRSDPGAAQG